MGRTEAPVTRSPDERREAGEAVALRELWSGHVWYARPAVVVADEPNLTMFHVPPHVICKEPVGPDGFPLRIPTERWELRDAPRGDTRILSFAFPETPYSVVLPFDEENRLQSYYVNLQTPLKRSPAGFDTFDYLLDVTIPEDRSSWSWKDEDEVQEAVSLGLLNERDVAWLRYWGEKAVEHVLLREPPFDEDWSAWRPDPSWEAPELPTGWDAAPA